MVGSATDDGTHDGWLVFVSCLSPVLLLCTQPAWWLEAVGYDHSKAVGVGSLAQAAPGAGKVPARAQLLPGVDATPLAAVGPLRQSAAEGGEGGEGASGSAQSNCNVPIATLAADLSEDGSQPVVVGGRSGGGATPFAALLGLLVVVAAGRWGRCGGRYRVRTAPACKALAASGRAVAGGHRLRAEPRDGLCGNVGPLI